jgi:hypothetical protein
VSRRRDNPCMPNNTAGAARLTLVSRSAPS